MADFQLKGGLEDNILTCLCWDADNAPALATKLKPELFSTRAYRRIAERAFAHIDEFGQPPRAHLPDLLEADMRGDEGKIIRDTLEAMQRLSGELQPAYVLKALAGFVRLRKLALAVEQAGDALAANDAEAAEEAMQISTAEADDGDGIWLHDTDRSLAFMDKKEEDYFSSDVPLLDGMGIRPARKTMMLLIAPPKKGKSWWLINVGKQGVMHRHHVLHITLENSEELTAQRYMQAFFGLSKREGALRIAQFQRDALGRHVGIDFDNVVPGSLETIGKPDMRAKAAVLKRRPRLLIKEFPTRGLTISMLTNYLNMLKRTKNFVPDLLVLDYADLLAVPGKDIRVETGNNFMLLRGIGVSRNMAIASATQGNRASATAKVVGTNMVAEDWSKIMTADTVLTYSQTGQEKELGLARLLVAAARAEADGFIGLISQSYANGQFCMDSVYMSKHVESDVKRLTGEAGEGDDD